jgi:hypothetical protein
VIDKNAGQIFPDGFVHQYGSTEESTPPLCAHNTLASPTVCLISSDLRAGKIFYGPAAFQIYKHQKGSDSVFVPRIRNA